MEVFSYAKINLTLLVLGMRPDGFHEIQSVMQTITLADRLTISLIPSGIQVVATHPDVPEGEENIIWKAITRFQQVSGERSGVRVVVEKNIPVAAGLGGGSSNAAQTLVALNQLSSQHLPDVALHEIAAHLGSDVPFFLRGGTALAKGRGELLSPLPFPGDIAVMLINPGFPVQTGKVFQKINQPLTNKYSARSICSAFSGDPGWSCEKFRAIENDLESVVFREYPVIRSIREWLLDRGADAAAVSGSGGTVFGLFADRRQAAAILEEARTRYAFAELAQLKDTD